MRKRQYQNRKKALECLAGKDSGKKKKSSKNKEGFKKAEGTQNPCKLSQKEGKAQPTECGFFKVVSECYGNKSFVIALRTLGDYPYASSLFSASYLDTIQDAGVRSPASGLTAATSGLGSLLPSSTQNILESLTSGQVAATPFGSSGLTAASEEFKESLIPTPLCPG